LRAGLLSGIYIPTKQQILDRGIVRQRYEIKSNGTRIKNRISSHIYFLGSGLRDQQQHWSKRYVEFLEMEAKKSGDLRLLTYVEQLKACRKFELQALRQIRSLSKEERFKDHVDLLLKIPGVGLLTAMVFLTEIMDQNRFVKKDSFMSYIGLIPGKISSGEKIIMSRRTNRGNKRLRTALIQSAWMAVRNYPELTIYYERCRQKQTANKAIIKVARKLAERMRYVYRTGKALQMN
jgi:transposase